MKSTLEMRDRKGVNLDGRGGGEEFGGVRGGETIIRMFPERKVFFSRKGKKNFIEGCYWGQWESSNIRFYFCGCQGLFVQRSYEVQSLKATSSLASGSVHDTHSQTWV